MMEARLPAEEVLDVLGHRQHRALGKMIEKVDLKQPRRFKEAQMPKPTKDPNLQEKMQHWVEKNPERWYTAKYEDIHVETGVSVSTLYRYFPLIVAKVAGIPPSEVKAKREEHMGVSPWRRKLSDEEISEIHRLYDEGHTTLDIAFVTGRSLSQIEKYNPNKKSRRKATEQG